MFFTVQYDTTRTKDSFGSDCKQMYILPTLDPGPDWKIDYQC